jgi:hypothetical protein
MENIENARQRIIVSKIYRGLFYLFLSLSSLFHLQKRVPVEFSIDCRLDQVNKFRGDTSLMNYFSSWFGVSLRFYPLIGEDILRD